MEGTPEEVLMKMFGLTNRKVLRTVKMDASDIARHQELCSRADALEKEYARAKSKILSDGERNWADMKDKHGLHGEERLRVNGAEAVIEILE